jgi:hypothetical protein
VNKAHEDNFPHHYFRDHLKQVPVLYSNFEKFQIEWLDELKPPVHCKLVFACYHLPIFFIKNKNEMRKKWKMHGIYPSQIVIIQDRVFF